MNHPFLETLFAYDRWATRVIIETCLDLSHEEFVRPRGIGPGSIERTLNHLVGAMFFFADRLTRCVPRPRLEEDGRIKTAGELLALFEQADREFGEAINHTIETHALTGFLNWTDTDKEPIDPTDQIPYALALAQMIDHSIQHRTQVADMLQVLGKGLPLTLSPFEWDEAQR
ncbi:MAG TPA: DinB family protein [Anaerolineae bacterium]|nr:DinB family protein [Anaerolineae bacterium]